MTSRAARRLATQAAVDEPGSQRLRLRVIACEALARPLTACAARSPHTVDIELLRRGLHDTPPALRRQLQAAIDAASTAEPACDAVILAYGLCGGATAGITARRVPVVLPRAHDCITLFLGSRARYQREFAADPGTYWYVGADDGGRDAGSQRDGGAVLGIGATSDDGLAAAYDTYVARYGKDNADYLMEALGGWRGHYDRAAFIDTGLAEDDGAEARARADAERRGWRFERLAADLALLARLVEGDWRDDFLILEPGQRLAMSHDASVVRAEPSARGR